ncbi:MAG TPA: di-heme oxidoredictase family protein [Woeseiaceae bacterium]|nr:di-heme oxidoredictase family protein [Woeseiaceae bacterium]
MRNPNTTRIQAYAAAVALTLMLPVPTLADPPGAAPIGQELSAYRRLENGEEYGLSMGELIARGKAAFVAQWTIQQGGGRPMTNGVGSALADAANPLAFPRNFNRISAQDSNGCAGCHNAPFGLAGGGGDFVTGVFVGAQRFDFATLDHSDPTRRRGAVDESGTFATIQTIGNYRATIGMFGSGFIEMLARQMTAELQSIRDGLAPGESAALTTKGVSFGTLARLPSGAWDVSMIEGLPPQSVATSTPNGAPSLIIRPFHQSGTVVSIREFTNNAFNHHHGMQSSERFGYGVDADGDGFVDELTRADITAVSVFQATLPVPIQVMSADPHIRRAIRDGTRLFESIGCADCHRPSLPLTDGGWIYSEPNPYNPAGNLQRGDAPPISVDLTRGDLPGRRLQPINGVVHVPAFTDLKLHDITSGPGDAGTEPLDINQPGGSSGFFAGNRKFLTKKLWGAANERPYFHHGLFTTLREATLAHDGEARAARLAFEQLTDDDRDRVIEFLKSLQVPPPLPEPETD